MVFFHKSLKLMLCKPHGLSLSVVILNYSAKFPPLTFIKVRTLVMIEKHNLCDGIIRFPPPCNIWSMVCNSCTCHILNNISLHASYYYYEAKEKNAITYDLLEAAPWQSGGNDNLFNSSMFWISFTCKAILNWMWNVKFNRNEKVSWVYFISFNSGLYGCDTPHR